MRLTLDVPVGPDGPRSFLVDAGRETRVGRDASAEIALAWDRSLSRRHFALNFDGKNCRLRDLDSTQGTLVNDQPVAEADLADGDQILAGSTLLRVRLKETLPAETPPSGPHAKVVATLRSQPEPLFAVLDAARDPGVLASLMESGEVYRSLFEGPKAMQYAPFAPYLVSIPADSRWLESVVTAGWGRSWGVFLTSTAGFDGVRRHLRRFLVAEMPDGARCLFRFYDPRVLPRFLDACSAEERDAFLAPFGRVVAERPGGQPWVAEGPRGPAAGRWAKTQSQTRPAEDDGVQDPL